MAETLNGDPEPPWKFPLEHRSASSSPLASSITLSYHDDGSEEREGGPAGRTTSDRPRLITEVDAKPPPAFQRETLGSPKRLKVDDQSPRHEQPDEREAARHRVAGNKERGRARGSPKGGELRGKKLACPYFKRNPRRDGRPVACIHPGFSNVARLKEHLYRIHKLPAICPRCQEQFDSEEEVTGHLNAPERCEKHPRKANEEGFDREQELKLRTKKRSKGEGSEEEKWRAVFMVLFPNTPVSEVPSPYVEHDTRPGSPDFPEHEARVLDGFEEFSRQELPQVIARVEPGLLGEQIAPQQLLKYLQACQKDLVESFRQREGYKNVTSHESVSGKPSQNRSRSGSKSSQSSDEQLESSLYDCSEQSHM